MHTTPSATPASVITLDSDQAAHLLLTINQLRNLALQALNQGILSRATHNNLIADVDLAIRYLNPTR